MAELRIEQVGKRFGAVQAVHDLSIDVASGEFIVLLGPSGAGKTTTLRLVAGLRSPTRAASTSAGAKSPPRRRRCAT
jgi:multiple sugar transport system ATP-binding protein